MQIQEAQKHVDPTDPDPEHWLEANTFFLLRFNSFDSGFFDFCASLWLRVREGAKIDLCPGKL